MPKREYCFRIERFGYKWSFSFFDVDTEKRTPDLTCEIVNLLRVRKRPLANNRNNGEIDSVLTEAPYPPQDVLQRWRSVPPELCTALVFRAPVSLG